MYLVVGTFTTLIPVCRNKNKAKQASSILQYTLFGHDIMEPIDCIVVQVMFINAHIRSIDYHLKRFNFISTAFQHRVGHLICFLRCVSKRNRLLFSSYFSRPFFTGFVLKAYIHGERFTVFVIASCFCHGGGHRRGTQSIVVPFLKMYAAGRKLSRHFYDLDDVKLYHPANSSILLSFTPCF